MIPFQETVHNFIFTGEAGSGKSEISAAFSCCLANIGRQVDFFDLDQTKPLFRSRDYLRQNQAPNLHLHFQDQFLDSPLSVPGISESLSDREVCTVVDLGGNAVGARMIAPFSHLTNRPDTITWFIVNPFRPWSCNQKVLNETIAQLSAHSRIASFQFLSNPTLGPNTTIEQVIEGHRAVLEMVAPDPVHALCIDQKLAGQSDGICSEPVFPISLSHSDCSRIFPIP